MVTWLVAAGCGDGKKDGGGPTVASMAIATDDKFKVGPGADPSVPAEMGGKGFEAIAPSQGWKTSTIPEDKFHLVADTNAIKGGRITFARPDFPATFRAYGKDENTAETRLIYGLVYESMLGVNPLTLDFLPGLATHWKSDTDGQTYYYRINPEARFSDGHRVTSADVLATCKLASDPGILNPYTNSFMAEFDTPEAVSMYIVKVRSKQKNWKNMFYFGGLSILPAHVIDSIDGAEYLKKYQYDMPPGSGPYIVMPSDVKRGESVTLTRRSNWWGWSDPLNRGAYNFDKIKMVAIRDENLAYEKFRAGELDIEIVSRAQWWRTKFDFEDVKRGVVQKRKVYTDDAVGFGGLAFNTRRKPYDDIRVREALTLLFNRTQILDKILYNEYLPTYSYYPNSPYENPKNPRDKYDPQRAGQLLAEAGYTTRNSQGILVKDGKPFDIDFPVTQNLSHIIAPIQEDFKRAGVNLKVRYVDGVTLFKLQNERSFDVAYAGWGGLLYPNPVSSFKSTMADQPNTTNLTGIKNPRVDELCDLEQVTFDQQERVRLLQELDALLVSMRHYAFNWHAPFTRLVYWNKFGQPKWYLGRLSDWRGVFGTWWSDPEKEAELAAARKDKTKKMPVGETDVKYWPEYDARNKPVEAADYSTQSSPGDTSGKTIK